MKKILNRRRKSEINGFWLGLFSLVGDYVWVYYQTKKRLPSKKNLYFSYRIWHFPTKVKRGRFLERVDWLFSHNRFYKNWYERLNPQKPKGK